MATLIECADPLVSAAASHLLIGVTVLVVLRVPFGAPATSCCIV